MAASAPPSASSASIRSRVAAARSSASRAAGGTATLARHVGERAAAPGAKGRAEQGRRLLRGAARQGLAAGSGL